MASDAEMVRKACEATRGRGQGCLWPSCTCTISTRLAGNFFAALIAAARAEGMEAAAKVADDLAEKWSSGDWWSAATEVAAAIRGGSHGE